jgi:hypothetical protein
MRVELNKKDRNLIAFAVRFLESNMEAIEEIYPHGSAQLGPFSELEERCKELERYIVEKGVGERAFDVWVLRDESWGDTSYRLWDEGFVSLEAALATIKGKKLEDKYESVRVMSNDREIMFSLPEDKEQLTNNK